MVQLPPQPTPGCRKRLEVEARTMKASPPDLITAAPNPSNILEWFYCLEGAPDTPYQGGMYIGTVTFPPNYPFAPPAIKIITPSGRFQVDVRLCLSISDYHPESWNPIWNIHTILIGLQAFMALKDSTLGSIESTVADKKRLALLSHDFNLKHPMFAKLFPEKVEKAQQEMLRVKANPELVEEPVKNAGKKRARE